MSTACRRSRPTTRGGSTGRARGALLLEVMLALAIFVMAGSAVLALVGGARTSMERMELERRCADLARSAMAKIEAGIESPQSLNGPVKKWSADDQGDNFVQIGGEAGEADPGWELHIETERTQFTGLTKVTVTAWKRRSFDGVEAAATFTLRQLVRLSGKGADEVGAVDDLSEEAKRGLGEATFKRPAREEAPR